MTVAYVWEGVGKSRVTGLVLAPPPSVAQVDTFFSCSRCFFGIKRDAGLQDIDVDSSHLSSFWRTKLVDLVAKYKSIFSRYSLDCGKTKDFVHRIQLSDNKPFRLPYHRL